MTDSMRIGIAYPQNELGGDPTALRRFARAAEDLGYDHLLMYDHVVGAEPDVPRNVQMPERAYTHQDSFHDPLVAFAHIAGMTQRIELVTGVLILPQRQTVLVARQAADVALLSGNRLRLGVGLGYNPVEYHALGHEFSRRGRRIAEQIPYLRRLWSGELQTFEGEFDQIDRAALCPAPEHPIPIWYGGGSEAAFRRAAELADGFVFGYGFSENAAAGWRRLQELLTEQGREIEGFRALFNLLPDRVGSSSIERIVEMTPRLRDLGATDVTVSTARHGLEGIDAHLRFMDEVMQRASAVLR